MGVPLIPHVTDTGMDVYDAPVYLFTDTGSYLGRMERTDSAGRTGFLLPARSYKFRVDYNGSQYWSDVINILADEETEVSLALDLLALDLTNDPNPVRFDGIPPKKKTDPVLLASLFDIPGILTQAIVANTGTGDAVFYFINDHLGTPKKIMDESGQVVWEADYKPFGKAGVTTSTIENGFRFPGQYFDGETGLHYNYHRYYVPITGRYLTPDPIGLLGGMNLWSYALNNPINLIDPLGLIIEADPFGTPPSLPVGEYFNDPKNVAALLAAGFTGGKVAAKAVKTFKTPWAALAGIPAAIGSYFVTKWSAEKGLEIIEKSDDKNNPCK